MYVRLLFVTFVLSRALTVVLNHQVQSSCRWRFLRHDLGMCRERSGGRKHPLIIALERIIGTFGNVLIRLLFVTICSVLCSGP